MIIKLMIVTCNFDWTAVHRKWLWSDFVVESVFISSNCFVCVCI